MSDATGTPRIDSLGGSFRDPSGFVFRRDGRLLRQVNRRYADHYDLLLSSGLYERLVADGLLVAHREIEGAGGEAYRLLEPELIPFISYPYEWCFSQLRDAALVTLRIHRLAIEHGMALKDASAFNVQFRNGQPLLIDTLSFDRYREGEPWVAYGQFCRHFLAPLALMSKRDIRLSQLLRSNIDGIPLDLARRLLPSSSAWSPSLLVHLTMHAAFSKKAAGGHERVRGSGRQMSRNAMFGLIDSLERSVRSLSWKIGGEWVDYYDDPNQTSEEVSSAKEAIVDALLAKLSPGSLWDIGGNRGRYSRIALRHHAPVISLDGDPGAVEVNYLTARSSRENLLPLWIDLANPSPAIGWNESERESLLQRGPADTAVALALMHHLAISNNVPFDALADFFAATTRRSLLIEYVPKNDPKVVQLLLNREDVFDSYSEAAFVSAMERRFTLVERAELPGSERVLLLMDKK